MSIVFARELPKTGMGTILNNIVYSFNTLYIKLSESYLKPKFHNLIHYGRILDEIGLLMTTNCSRFESFHLGPKEVAYNSNNRINLLETISIKQQIKIANNLINLDEIFENSFKIFPGQTIQVPNIEEIKKIYKIECNIEFEEVSYLKYNNFKFIPHLVVEIDICQNSRVRTFAIIEKL